jgi:hypothetical protein
MEQMDIKQLLQTVAQKAAETGADAAMKHLEAERRKKAQLKADRRLNNCEVLLKNYRNLKKAAENAVFDAESAQDGIRRMDEDILETEDIRWLMNEWGTDRELTVNAIMDKTYRTILMVRHIDTMVDAFRQDCLNMGTASGERRIGILEDLYLNPLKEGEDIPTQKQLSEKYSVAESMITQDKKYDIEQLSVLIFGMDGVYLPSV